MRLVGLFIAGNSKSGTSALCDYLDQHPALCLSDPKEPNYFATDFTHSHPEGAFTKMTADAYHACFRNPSADVLVDGSACYLYSREAPARIADYNPAARIVVIFREPADFLYSYHLQMLRNVAAEGETIKDLGQALDAEAERREGRRLPAGCRVPAMLYYAERLNYADQFERLLRYFPREQIRVYLYDEFRADNMSVVRDVYGFAGVEPGFEPSRTEVNAASRTRAPRLSRAVQDLAHGRGQFAGLNRAITSVLPSPLRRKMLRSVTRNLASSDKGALAPETRLRIRDLARDQVGRLGELIGRDLPAHWGYTRVSEAP